ncbi:glycosyltransferase [Actinospica sp.]|uniref:glycosyltransferase n=1 Tax=Actinospica sp. TaxID=1872142 RepID=UPI002C08E844|nr:glycosyltransferase [Actinospica sp.]HWG25217.1 glycosyltransferase [Actinospica sp.]
MVTYGFLSTYPPTQCGLATFSAALMRHLADPTAGEHCGVIPVVDAPVPHSRHDTTVRLVNGQAVSALRATDALNGYDVMIFQHEYGVYGGTDGEDVLDVLAGVEIPIVAVLHTVLASPTPHQRSVLQQVIDESAAVVVLSHTAERALLDGYLIDAERISVIPHGAVTPTGPRGRRADGGSPRILTWGLIGPGKGIEWAIAALGHLHDLHPAVRYLVAGQTHPKVLAEQGETYRAALRGQAETLGVADQVEFDSTYREIEPLTALVRDADLILLPYDSTEQATSGVLVEAIAARRPVIATDFPHARELLAGGAGIVVPHRDPAAMAGAIRRVLTEPGLSESMTARCGDLAPALGWDTVADSYRTLARTLLDTRTGQKVAL